jgi:ATPase subunit of ABC transporter with duplicated ATPase domains
MATKEQICQRHVHVDGVVEGVGVIETGFTTSSKAISTRSGLGVTDKSLTTDASNRIGTVILKKCEAKASLGSRLHNMMGAHSRRGNGDVSCCTTKSTGNGKKSLLHPTRVNVPEGSITAIVGTSESGKSTLLKFMAGCADRNLECAGVGELIRPYCSLVAIKS